ncbi:MAG: hypothetical protein LC733_07645 [Actinobacteria bacterium]|nr:hypothetical protein [Actinomycetota bacterium]
METAVRAGGASRAEEAALTTVGFEPRFNASTYLGGAVALLLLLMIGLRSFPATPDARLVAIAAGGVAVLYVLRFSRGLGFVPGLVATTPLAAIGVARCWANPRARIVGIIGLAALPVVWATQYTGGAGPQWAGRYILPSGLLLAVAGVAALPRLQRWVGAGLVALAVAVTIFGVAWLSERSHGVGRSAEALARRPEPVLISRLAFLAREGGWYVNDRRWLTAVTDNDVSRAARAVKDAGLEGFGLVEREDVAEPTTVPGFRATGTDRLEFVAGVQLRVTTFVRNR